MKKIILAVALTIAVSISVVPAVRAWEMSTADGSGSVTVPEHRITVFGTATNFGKSDSADKYDTAYRFAAEFESDSLSHKNFSIVPGFYHAAIGIDKAKREYTINPVVAGSLRYNLWNFISLGVGYGTNGSDKSGPIYSGKFNLYKFKNDVGIEAGALFSNIGESGNSYMVGVSFPLN